MFPGQYHYMTSRVVYIPGGSFQSGGHNVFSDTPAAPLDPTDLINTDPLLGPLADNGGPTLTQALLPGSPAIDAGTAVSGVTTDQRGVPRPQGNAPDIGAFEVEVPHTGFYALSEPSIAYGTATVTVSGNIEFGKQVPTGKVVITLNNVAQSAPIDPFRGHFSAVFAATGLHVSAVALYDHLQLCGGRRLARGNRDRAAYGNPGATDHHRQRRERRLWLRPEA